MSHSNSRPTGLPDDGPLDSKILDSIGRALKAHYDDLVRAPLPDRFLDLLAALEDEDQGARAAAGDSDAAR